jgi:hypothetical protein
MTVKRMDLVEHFPSGSHEARSLRGRAIDATWPIPQA